MNKVKKNKITYITNPLRIKRVNNNNYSKEFLYFYHKLNSETWDKKIIELNDNYKKSILYVIEKFLIKFLNIPFYSHKLNLSVNFKTIFKSNYLILTNETMAYSIYLPFFLISKKNKPKIFLFVMGFFEPKKNKNIIKNIVNKRILNYVDRFLFLSRNEYKYALLKYPQFKEKFIYFGFSIDYKFWNITEVNKKNDLPILFNGNDLNRNYELMMEIIEKMQDQKFIIVSNKINNLSFKNVEVFSTSIKQDLLTDTDLKNLYSKTKFSLIPLIETLQPSGQSVALQSICTNNIVFITPTKGFWEYQTFINNKNIVFVEGGLNKWVSSIRKYNIESKESASIIYEAKEIVKEKYDIEQKYQEFLTILEES